MKKLVLIACCLLICMMATNAHAENLVSVESKSFASGQIRCTVGVFISNDIPLVGLVVPLEIRTISGDVFYLGRSNLGTSGATAAADTGVWNYTRGGRLLNSPLGDVGGANWPAGNATRRVYPDTTTATGSNCTGRTSSVYFTSGARGDTTSPDGFLLAVVSTGDPIAGEDIVLAPGEDNTGISSMRFLLNMTPGTNGCMKIDTACVGPANVLGGVDENTGTVPFNFTPGLITVGNGSCAAPPVNLPPTAICQNIQVVADGNCQGTATAAQVNNGSNDPEDLLAVTLSLVPAGPYTLGANSVKLIVTDSDGAADTCDATITVVDQTAPVLNCPSNIAVQCPADIPAAYADAAALVTAGGSVSDNCSIASVALLDQTSDGNTCPNVITRRYVATDGSGNKDTCSQTITVDDTQAPVLTCHADTIVNVADGGSPVVVNFTAATATDNCTSPLTPIAVPASGTAFPEGQTVVTVTVADACGNMDTCSFTVTVVEAPPVNTPPTAICQNVQVGTDGNCQGSANAAAVNNGSNDAQDGTNLSLVLNPAGPYALGANQVWLVVTDQGGLKDSCEATITVVDDDVPSISCPPQITNVCDDAPGYYSNLAEFLAAGGTASDNCDASLTLSFQGQNCATGQSCDLMCTRTYRVTDDAGNFAECQQVLRIRDSIPPVLGPCPVNISATVSAGTTDTVITFSLPSATDNCGSASVVATPPSGASFPVGQTTVTVIATDNCGNADTCTFTVTVTEEVPDAPPSALCTDVKVPADADCQADGSINNGSFDPDGGPVSVSQSPAGPYSLGSTLVLLTVTDDEGDTDTCSAWVTVNDVTPPVAICPGDMKVANDPGACGAVVSWSNHISDDNCGQLSFLFTPASGSLFPVGTTQVQEIVTDGAGNADTCTFTVTVNDTTKPTVTCSDVKFSNDAGECGRLVYASDLVPSIGYDDNCGVTFVQFSVALVKSAPAEKLTQGVLFIPVGTFDAWVHVYDAAGNVSDSCEFTITINDTEAPTIECPGDFKVFAPFGQTTAIVNYPAPVTTDNCLIDRTRCYPESGSSFDIGTTVVTCTTWDATGNYTICSFTITVNPGSPNAPGPHTDIDVMNFKVLCACDTQSIDVYCIEPPIKGDTAVDGCLYYIVTDVPGISGSPSPGTAPRKVDIIGCRGDLDAGTYSGWVYIHAVTGAKTDSFWVVLEVNDDTPGIDVKQDTLRFTYTGDIFNDKLCLPIEINSTGCDETCWELANSTGDWVWVDPTSGTTPGSPEVCVTPCAFKAGDYFYTLHFCPCDKSGGPTEPSGCDSLVVKLTVVDPPVLVVDPVEIHFEIDCEKKALPVPVIVTNDGGGVLTWDAWTNANWFVIEPDNGEATDTFYVSIVPDSIPCPTVCDTLIDSICVYGNKGCALNSPQWVTVQLIICPPDTSVCDSLCGYVFDMACQAKNGCDVNGATVELWSSYPDGVLLSSTTTVDGKFCFDVAPGEEYDIRVWKKGYCTEVVGPWSCEDGPLVIELKPIEFSPLPNWPYFTDYYSSDAMFVVDDVPYYIQPGDVIYATDPQGVICGITYVEMDSAGTYLIHVLGDDIKTPEDEGALPGDSITLWLNCECPVVAPDTWLNFGSYRFDALWDCDGPDELCCVLCEGWNMWSYNIQVPDYAREAVLATIDLNYDAVRSGLCDYGSISWFANRPINDLIDVSPWYGYDIHMLQEDTVCLSGDFIDPQTEIELCEGWNYIPYLPSSSDNLENALQSLDGNYAHIFTMYCEYGVASWNELRDPQNNDLTCMEPCKGYWIKMKSDDTLIYPKETEGCLAASKIGYSASSSRVTTSPMVADYYAPYSNLSSGSTISVFNSSGTLIGESEVGASGAFLLHVYGDVPQTGEIEGAMHAEELTFQVNGLAASASGNIQWFDRDNRAIQLTIDEASGSIPTEYSLLQNYPNPFNAGTVIPFTMKDASEWTLTVYNIMGQTVQSFAGFEAPGTVRVNWNGLDQNGANVPSGVYFYRVTTATWSATKKMTLLK